MRHTNHIRSPTSGGQYHWVSQLAPARSAVVFSWTAGKRSLPNSPSAILAYWFDRMGLDLCQAVCLCQRRFRSWGAHSRVADIQCQRLRATKLACHHALLDGAPGCYDREYPRHQGFSSHRERCIHFSYLLFLRPTGPFGLSHTAKFGSICLRRLRECRWMGKQWSFVVPRVTDLCMVICW